MGFLYEHVNWIHPRVSLALTTLIFPAMGSYWGHWTTSLHHKKTSRMVSLTFEVWT